MPHVVKKSIFHNTYIFYLLAIYAALSATAAVSQELPIIPGAMGWGINTIAGSGRHLTPPSTQIIRVTNLNDNGPGSLRDAVMQTSPRTVIFDVSGEINLNSRIILGIDQSYLTIAGQTAPSPGITVRGNSFVAVDAHDILIQHLRFRVGPVGGDPDGIGARKGNSNNIVFDHVSVSWGIDENIGLSHGANNITVRYSIISEALDCATHSEGCHSRGFLASRSNHTLIYGNIMAHNLARNPRWGKTEDHPPTSSVVVNNVIYNWESGGTQIPNGNPGGIKDISIAGNVYMDGVDTGILPIEVEPAQNTDIDVYLNDNMYNGVIPNDPWDIVTGGGEATTRVNEPPVDPNGDTIWVAGLVPLPPNEVIDHVVAHVGARPSDRDTVDRRIINDILNARNGNPTGSIIDDPNEVGGFPILAQNTRVLTLPNNPSGDDDGDGYTNLEEWLHYHAALVEGDGSTTISEDPTPIMERFVLHQNFPNPFNPTTTIRFQMPIQSSVSLKIYNILGKEIVTLVNDVKAAGLYTVKWDGKSQSGSRVPSGLYFYKLESGEFISFKKMLLLK